MGRQEGKQCFIGQQSVPCICRRTLLDVCNELLRGHAAGHAGKVLQGGAVQIPLLALQLSNDLVDLVFHLFLILDSLQAFQ